jgi:S1-C subfamily serine protease
MVGNVMVPVEPRDIAAQCRGDEHCIKLCEDALEDPGWQTACDQAQAAQDPEHAKPAPKRVASKRQPEPEAADDDVLHDAHPVWGPGSRRHPNALPPAGLFARAASAVVVVQTPDGLGSGFAVHGSGVIVTNLHVVRGAKQIEIVFWNGKKLKVRRVEAFDEQHDLAVLRIRNQVNTLPVAPKSDLLPGEHIVAIGNPLGLQLTISEGVVGGIRRMPGGEEVIQITAAISPGSSGGPILNQWGEVVGVATFKFKDGESLNFAMPARYVRELLATPKPLSLTDFAAATKRDEAADTAKDEAEPRAP